MRAILVIAVLVLSGCVGVDPDLPRLADPGAFTLEDLGALALVEALDARGARLWTASADIEGVLKSSFTGNESRLLLWEQGKATVLDLEGTPLPGASFEGLAPIAFGARYDFPNPEFPVQLGTTCTEKDDDDTSCGLDEPSIVVDGRGWIHYTAACCFVVSSPVFVSKDGGKSFTQLEHMYKDSYGNEGDVWLDAGGNLYYMDIDLATWGFAQWDKDLKPVHGERRPGEPIVDRPWVRATKDGIVFAMYNTAIDTIVYRSTDHGKNFDPMPVARMGAGLAVGYSDSRRGIVGMVAGGEFVESRDDGVTWSAAKAYPCRDPAPNVESAAVDEGGTVWFLRKGCLVGKDPEGKFTKARDVVPKGIRPFFSWIGAGAEGSVAVAYYGKPESGDEADLLGLEEKYYTFVAYSADAASANPHWATVLVDPEPVASGDLETNGPPQRVPNNRRLGDFMEVAIAPDGGIHVAYARNPEMDDSATAVYRGTGPMPSLAPTKALVGPYAA